MASITLAKNVAGGDIESGNQARDAMSLVVVGASLQLSDPHGQHRLCTAQSLNLRLLIDAQHQRVMGRIQIQSDNIPHLVDQQWVAGKLKALRTMRLQPEARQKALTVDWLNPVLAANIRLDQWVAPFGVVSNVSRTSRSIFSSPISRGAPGRGSSPSPATPSAMKRLRQRPTVKPVVCKFAATPALLAPLAQARTIRARNAADLKLRDCRAIRSNSTRCAGLTTR